MPEIDWIKLSLLCLAGAASPGLSWLMILTMSISRGTAVGVYGAIGHGLGITVFALSTIFGLSALLFVLPALSQALNWSGIGLLAFFGYRLVRSGHPPLPESLTTQSGLIAGFGIAIVNPKVLVFFLAIFGPFVNPSHSLQNHLLMGFLAGAIDTIVYLGVAYFAHAARGLLKSNIMIGINQTIGALLLVSALMLGIKII